VILRNKPGEEEHLQKFTALGALAVCEAVEALGLPAKIKWPNDILLNGRKFCGILAETGWMDAKPLHVVLGIGVNVHPPSVPANEELNFPATCLDTDSGKTIDRLTLLQKIVKNIFSWRPQVGEDSFMSAWERHLSFIGEKVFIRGGKEVERIGLVQGLEWDGSLRLLSPDGDIFFVQVGEIHLHRLI
jgi:BirA family biotin operon repressor/biotin-[acetyl-CoA-carboxylase] ligase